MVLSGTAERGLAMAVRVVVTWAVWMTVTRAEWVVKALVVGLAGDRTVGMVVALVDGKVRPLVVAVFEVRYVGGSFLSVVVEGSMSVVIKAVLRTIVTFTLKVSLPELYQEP